MNGGLMVVNSEGLERRMDGYVLIGPMDLPSKIIGGSLRLSLAIFDKTGNKYYLIEKGDVDGKEDILFRINSKCVYADIFGSARCDCREQLHDALHRLNKEDSGLMIYAYDQDGRGISLRDHLKVYMLQDRGLDTVQANEAVGLKPDHRDYSEIIRLLKDKMIKSVRIMTNNPDRVRVLEENGIHARRIPIHSAALNPINVAQLSVKKSKLGHKFEYDPIQFWVERMKGTNEHIVNRGEFADLYAEIPCVVENHIIFRPDGFKIAGSNDLQELIRRQFAEKGLILATKSSLHEVNNPSIERIINIPD